MKLAILISVFAFSGCICNVPAAGEKVGQIVKVEQTGIVCNTWEAELIRGGLTAGSGVAGGAPFHFTVPAHLVKDAQDAMKHNREVTVRYDRKIVSSLCTTNSGGVFAKRIDPAGADSPE